MPDAIIPDLKTHRAVVQAVQADIDRCYTCGTCPGACPINKATSLLSPLALVRMAVFGLLGELIRRPEIWYCLGCQACAHDCPMAVKPSRLIAYLRREALRQEVYSPLALNQYATTWNQYQLVRWWLAEGWRQGRSTALDQAWQGEDWSEYRGLSTMIRLQAGPGKGLETKPAGNVGWCFTCGECRGVCPIFQDHGPFDPLGIFRLVNLGLGPEVLGSTAIWLCLGCRRCTENCCQKVSGHQVIQDLRSKALLAGYVSRAFADGWPDIDKQLYPYFVTKVNEAFGPEFTASG